MTFQLCKAVCSSYNPYMDTYKTGLFAEWYARMYLRLHGYKILRSRYITGRHTGRAEIDIIARRKNLIVFVEVKCRPNIAAGWDAINSHQVARLRRAAETYLVSSKWRGDARFDVMIVCGARIYWARGAI